MFASGERKAFDLAKAIFPGFSRSHYYLGAFGNGSRMKFVANLLVAIHNVSAAEAFVLGMKAGLPAKTIFEVIENSAGTSRMFQVRGPQMVKGRYDGAGIAVELFQKDMKIIGEFAARIGAPTVAVQRLRRDLQRGDGAGPRQGRHRGGVRGARVDGGLRAEFGSGAQFVSRTRNELALTPNSG